jgi:hypothetical protein
LAYVGDPFAYDIFVSYSHGDPDGTGTSKLHQWSNGFVRELESELRQFPQLAGNLRIFLDNHHRPSQGLDPMAPLTAQLRDDIERSAFLTVLMSPHYLKSKWCQDERDWWYDKQRQLGLPQDGRIAVARIWPTTPDDGPWPAALADERGESLVGFAFYDKANAELLPQPYEWPEPGPASKNPFRKELLTLVGHLRLKLEEVRKRLDEQRHARQEAERLATGDGRVVYLHGRADHAVAWDNAQDELSRNGLVVLPGEPDPIVSDARQLQDVRQRRVEIMSGCDALLLVAAPDARAVDADLVVVGRQDRNSARAISNHLLPCALLDCVGTTIATPARRVVARSLNVEWIDATQPLWPPAVRQWLLGVGRGEATV